MIKTKAVEGCSCLVLWYADLWSWEGLENGEREEGSSETLQTLKKREGPQAQVQGVFRLTQEISRG